MNTVKHKTALEIRLDRLKERAKKCNDISASNNYTWRDFAKRFYKRKFNDKDFRVSDDGEKVFAHTQATAENLGFYFEGYAHELVRQDHTGWYADEGGFGIVAGAVVMLRGHRTRANRSTDTRNYYSVITHSEWDEFTILIGDAHSTPEDAARSADKKARVFAERCREDERKDRAEQEVADRKEAFRAANTDLRFAISALREAQSNVVSDSVFKAVWLDLQHALTDRKEALTELVSAKQELAYY